VFLVGLTGGIGSGKTTVSCALGDRGAVVVDADAIVHELQQPGQRVLSEMVELLGAQILREDGTLDRQAVADLVFSDAGRLADLGGIVHPRVREEITARVIAELETDNIVVLDIPLLAESGWEGIVGTIVVDLDPEIAVGRLVEHRGFAEHDARARMANQASRADRVSQATWVVDNSGDLESLAREIELVWSTLVALRDDSRP